MKTVAIIQARLSSVRLPGKVLLPLAGKTVLARVIERVQLCSLLDEVIVATTHEKEDDAIVAETVKCGATVFRGDLNDVLGRYYGAACASRADVVVRITSDCPLFDPYLLRDMLKVFHQRYGQMDYLSNVTQRTFPRGLDTEIFTFAALKKAHEEAKQTYEREHVTVYFHRNPTLFRLESFLGEENHSANRWTLDMADDYKFIQTLYESLSPQEITDTKAILKFLSLRPDMVKINAHVEQKKTN